MDKKCAIKDIQSVIFGPHTITFKQWRLREFTDYMKIIMADFEQRRNEEPDITGLISQFEPKFYSWECVSIKMKNRTLDFVIKDENLIIRFLRGMNMLVSILSHEDDNKERDQKLKKTKSQGLKVRDSAILICIEDTNWQDASCCIV